MVVKDHQVLRNIHDLQERDQPDQQYTLLTYSWQTNYSSLIVLVSAMFHSCTAKQVDDVLENFPTSSMSCRSCHAWAVDVDFLLMKLFFLFSNNYFFLERRQTMFQECLQCADNKYQSLNVKRREQNSKVLLSGCSAKMLLI